MKRTAFSRTSGRGGQAAVAKFRLGLDVDVDGRHRQSVFVKGLPGGAGIIDFIRIDDFHTVIALDIGS
jgi:hypothetical protein